MKVNLIYKLPEEITEFETAMNSGKNHSMLWEIQQYVRTLRKYDEREMVPKEEIINAINELLTEFES